MSEHKESSVASYIIIALILGVITYVEFAIVEYTISWLNPLWTFVILAVLSVLKFVLVVAYFMHLKDDENLYTGFFSSGMAIALGTFIALSFLFILPRSVAYARAQAAEQALLETGGGHGESEEAGGHEGVPEEIEEAIATKGYSRPLAERFDSPPPKTQYLAVEGPADDSAGGFQLLPVAPLFQGTPDTAPEADTTELDEEGVTDAVPVEPDPEEVGAGAEADDATDVTADADGESAAAGQAEDEGATDDEAQADEADEAADTAQTEDAEADVEPDDATDDETDPEAADAATDEPEEGEDGTDPTAQAPAGDFDAALGEQTYTNCVACHQANGAGLPGVFPPLAGHMPVLYAAEGGRTYLIHTLLYGLQGEIDVLGQSYNGAMPGWAASLSDEQIAAVLNHELTAWGNADAFDDFEPITPDEVAAERDAGLSPSDVLDERAALSLP